jgi:hypothetical protein
VEGYNTVKPAEEEKVGESKDKQHFGPSSLQVMESELDTELGYEADVGS